LRGGKRSVPPLSAFFRKKESFAKKANCRAAPLSRLDRRFWKNLVHRRFMTEAGSKI